MADGNIAGNAIEALLPDMSALPPITGPNARALPSRALQQALVSRRVATAPSVSASKPPTTALAMTPSPSEELLAQLLVNVSALTSEVMQLKTCVVQRDKAATTMAKEMVELKRELKGLAKSSKDSAKASTKRLAGIPNIEKAVVYVRKHTKKVRST
jgi:hypothetical protein